MPTTPPTTLYALPNDIAARILRLLLEPAGVYQPNVQLPVNLSYDDAGSQHKREVRCVADLRLVSKPLRMLVDGEINYLKLSDWQDLAALLERSKQLAPAKLCIHYHEDEEVWNYGATPHTTVEPSQAHLQLLHQRLANSLCCLSLRKLCSAARCMLPKLTNLYALHLEEDVDDSALQLLQPLQQLQTLRIISSENFTDAGLTSLATLPALSNLNLWGCSQVSDSSLACLAELRGLTSLNISWCREVTDDGMASLQLLPQLEVLVMLWCSISDAGLAKLCGCTGLKHLDLSGCRKLTPEGLRPLPDCLPRLRMLSVRRCRPLGPHQAAWKLRFPGLTVLHDDSAIVIS